MDTHFIRRQQPQTNHAYTIIIFALLVVGCSSQKKLTTSQLIDNTNVSTKIEYIEKLRDTIIYLSQQIERTEIIVQQDSSLLETSAARSIARINHDGTLFHSLENKKTKIPVTISIKDKQINQSMVSSAVQKETIEIPVRMALRWYEKTLIYCGVIALLLAIIKIIIWLTLKKT